MILDVALLCLRIEFLGHCLDLVVVSKLVAK